MATATRYAASHCSIGTKGSTPDNILGIPDGLWASCLSSTPQDIFGTGFDVSGLSGTINSVVCYFRIKTSGFDDDTWRLEHDWGSGSWVVDKTNSSQNVGQTDYGPYSIDIAGKEWADIPNIRLHIVTSKVKGPDDALAEVDAVWVVIDYSAGAVYNINITAATQPGESLTPQQNLNVPKSAVTNSLESIGLEQTLNLSTPASIIAGIVEKTEAVVNLLATATINAADPLSLQQTLSLDEQSLITAGELITTSIVVQILVTANTGGEASTSLQKTISFAELAAIDANESSIVGLLIELITQASITTSAAEELLQSLQLTSEAIVEPSEATALEQTLSLEETAKIDALSTMSVGLLFLIEIEAKTKTKTEIKIIIKKAKKDLKKKFKQMRSQRYIRHTDRVFIMGEGYIRHITKTIKS